MNKDSQDMNYSPKAVEVSVIKETTLQVIGSEENVLRDQGKNVLNVTDVVGMKEGKTCTSEPENVEDASKSIIEDDPVGMFAVRESSSTTDASAGESGGNKGVVLDASEFVQHVKEKKKRKSRATIKNDEKVDSEVKSTEDETSSVPEVSAKE